MRGNCQQAEPRPTHAKLENNFVTEFKPAVVATYKMSLSRPQWFQGLFEGAIFLQGVTMQWDTENLY